MHLLVGGSECKNNIQDFSNKHFCVAGEGADFDSIYSVLDCGVLEFVVFGILGIVLIVLNPKFARLLIGRVTENVFS